MNGTYTQGRANHSSLNKNNSIAGRRRRAARRTASASRKANRS